MMKKILLLLLLLTAAASAANPELQARLDYLLRSVPKNTKYGVMIYNPLTRDTLYQRNIQQPVKPASNIKLFTTAVAFSLMGADYQLSTKIFTDDIDLTDGVVNGNLYIKGFGNSVFTDEDLDAMASELSHMGIRRVTGSIIGDDSYFDDVYHRSDWIEDEVSSVTLPPISAIVINRNKLSIGLAASTKVGAPLAYDLSPASSLIKVRMNAKTTRGRSRVSIQQRFDNGTYDIIISGGLRRKTRIAWYTVEIKNPPLFAASLLTDRLARRGVSVDHDPSTGITPETVTELNNRSITLRELSKIVNKRSDNFLAECLFKTVGAYYSRSQGSAFFATQAVLSYLNSNNIYPEGAEIVDGSGLSHFNHVAVGTIASLLEKMYFNQSVYGDYFNSLAIAGIDGTLRGRMSGTAAENNFHGKTGTLNGVTALSGYLKGQDGQDLIVSIVFEYSRGSAWKFKNIEDQIVRALTEPVRL